ncbi:MAG: AMP-binding protein [Clostridia bacterium]
MLERFLPRIEFDSYEDFKKNYRVNVPASFNFGFDIVDAWAAKDRTKKALVWCDDHGNEKTLTFEDIRKSSNRTANYFMSLGIKKGSVIMVILRRRWEYWVIATAIHKIGAILIPASLQLTKKDMIYRAVSANVSAFICVNDPFVIAQAELALPECPSVKNRIIVAGEKEGWENFDLCIKSFSDELRRPEGKEATKNSDTMLLYFTSGTTGMPKMVHHDFTYPLGHIVTAKYWQQAEEGKLHMSVSDSGWAKFGWGKIYGQWIVGAVIFAYDMDKFVPLNLLRMIEKYRLTTFCAPPTMYRFMLQEDVSKFDLSSVKHFCIAGEPLNPEVFRKWKELTGISMTEGFGQTESSVMIANFPWFDPKPGSMGKPSPLYDIKLINSEGKECEDGEEGEIVVSGIDKDHPLGLFSGYIKDFAKGDAIKLTDEYNLKDVAWRDSEGYYWFVGRNDDVIKCSGYRIGPFEVESALLEHKAVVECAVTAVPDPIRGQIVKATVVLAKDYTPSPALVKELQDHVKNVTAPYKYPRIIEFTEELPKTIGGKIKRGEIRNKDSNQ